ncbi:uncharacterized protein N7473_012544 [Penicillium subrubescens]|uniref:uncharacterized protein n=1 Tax=Penicillium subrubescens TaxID=1316194 RepID=UPI002544E733|nr:uncharacterized protein N7473_012544 [Penicillium subrubescens]KAJ5875197.1 hypothetical protein N7473_012544 [Penicillium subrubescens]
MGTNISYDGSNSGLQIGENHGDITAQFVQPEASLNQACLRDLRTTSPHDDKDRIEQTNGGLLIDSYRWILDNEQFKQWQDNQSSRLLWIKGDPGKGKTMLLCGIINELTRSIGDNANLAFFFCQATDVRINSATAVLRGLIYSLVVRQASLLSHVRSRYDQAGKTLFEDINAWNALSKIFNDMLKDPTLQNTYLVIDALDECTKDLPLLLNLVVQESSTYPHVKWIVSSRNWPGIEERLNTTTQTAPISLELNELSVHNAVQQFIRHKVHQLAEVKKYKDEMRDVVYRHLSSHSQGTFLWVALEFPPGLDALYGRMIDQVRTSEDAEICKRILAVMLIAYRPITLDELTALVEIPDDLSDDDEALLEIIALCGSFLTWREDFIVFIHQSAKEFLLEKARIEVFPEGQEAQHLAIFSRSLQTMFKTLQHNILDLKLGVSTDGFTHLRSNPLTAVKYSCVYWVDHLLEGWCGEDEYHSLDDGGCVYRFLQQKYLHWLESLGILGSVLEGITAMLKLEDLLQKKGESRDLLDRVQDASRFIRYHRNAIEISPLQVYSSGLVFSPTQSTTRTCYQKEKPDWILNSPVVDGSWSSCLQTLEGHSDSVTSITWSPDGSRLTSASYDRTVRIWDPATGQCLSTLEGHIDSVTSITWSPDGSRLASASYDRTVRIWDPATGQCLSTLEGHSDSVTSITWSPDRSRLASASYDRTVRIWNPATGQCASTLEGHSDSVTSIAWSLDGSRLASASYDKTVRIWDPATGQCATTLEGHSGLVTSIAWSPDGSRLASASSDKTVRIWDLATGQYASTLERHSSFVNSITWSPDGSRLALVSYDKTVRIWDPATDQCAATLDGHSSRVTSIAWSPDGSRLTSASHDETLRIWDPATGQCLSTLKGHSDTVTSIAWSPDGSRLASASADNTVRIWDPATSQCASTLEGHSDLVTSIAWSPDGSRLASASADNTVRIWDPATGQCGSTIEGHSDSVNLIAWSLDGSRLASASSDKTVRIWDPATGQCASTIEGHSDSVNSIAWSPDGSRLALSSYDKTVRIWDPATGQCATTLEGHSSLVTSIAWSPDGSRLASASSGKTARIWDLATGQCAATLKGHSRGVMSITWSSDGSRLASASSDKTVRIWNPATGQCVSTLDIHSYHFLQFDRSTPTHLHTVIGTLNLGSTEPVAPGASRLTLPKIHGFGLSGNISWITFNGSNLLWLPPEYRPSSPSSFRISAATVAIGCSSGRVIFLALSDTTPYLGYI